MAEMKLRHYFLGVGIFILMITGVISLIYSVSSESDTFLDANSMEEFNRTFNKQHDFLQKQEELENKTTSLRAPSKIEFIYTIYEGGFTVVKTAYNMVGLSDDIIKGVSDVFGHYIPSWFTTMLIGIITLFLVLIVIGLFIQRDI